ncbi:MAG: ABC transporter ATP-binding protein [Lewinella sp.]|uniref:ABC transporter ATP-binding protein n=1 Tax=Lewinella sp. TaxID=2004506 RepID=UPI003D6C37FF
MLSTHNVSFSFASTREACIHLNFPDFECQTGEHWLLLGQSGSGKTTLLHLLAGLRTPLSGEIKVNDTVLNQLSGAKLDQFRGREIGVIFQQSHFLRALTVGENLAMARQLVALPPDDSKIKALLEQLNIGHKFNALPSELSVGEQQRVAIARALVNDPTVILADEPTSALDDKNTEQVVELLKAQAQAANATLLVVTHDNRLKNIFDQQIEL